jgi:hypothetical protein
MKDVSTAPIKIASRKISFSVKSGNTHVAQTISLVSRLTLDTLLKSSILKFVTPAKWRKKITNCLMGSLIS